MFICVILIRNGSNHIWIIRDHVTNLCCSIFSVVSNIDLKCDDLGVKVQESAWLMLGNSMLPIGQLDDHARVCIM